MRILTFIILVCTSSISFGQLQLDSKIDSLAKVTNFNGCISVNSPLKKLTKCFGKVCKDSNSMITPNTIFEIGSTSKQFTAVALLELLKENSLNTRTPLNKFFREIPEDKQKITIHQLLTHSSGLETYHDKRGPLENLSQEKALKRIFKQKLKFNPGEKYSYSNSGYTLLALIIEKLSGEDFKSYMSKMLKRYGLVETGFYGDRLWKRDEVACGYSFRKDGHPYDRGVVKWGGLGSGYMMSSVKDYSKWLCLIVSGDLDYPKMFEKHIRYTDVKDEAYYGYGWVIAEKDGIGEYYYHNGGDTSLGYITTVRIYPKQEAYLIITSNTFNHQPHELFEFKNIIEDWLITKKE